MDHPSTSVLLPIREMQPKIANQILWHLREACHRDASEELIKYGLVTSQEYTNHWHRRCCEVLKRELPLPTTNDPAVDFGWFFCFIEAATQEDRVVDVSGLLPAPSSSNNDDDQSASRMKHWVDHLQRKHNEFWRLMPVACGRCCGRERAYTSWFRDEQTLHFTGNYRGELMCLEYQRATVILVEFFDRVYPTNPMGVDQTIRFVMENANEYFQTCGSTGPLSIGIRSNVENYANRPELHQILDASFKAYIEKRTANFFGSKI